MAINPAEQFTENYIDALDYNDGLFNTKTLVLALKDIVSTYGEGPVPTPATLLIKRGEWILDSGVENVPWDATAYGGTWSDNSITGDHAITVPNYIRVILEPGAVLVRVDGIRVQFTGELVLTEGKHFHDDSDAYPANFPENEAYADYNYLYPDFYDIEERPWETFIRGGKRQYFTPIHFGASAETEERADAEAAFHQCAATCHDSYATMRIPAAPYSYLLSKWHILGFSNGLIVQGDTNNDSGNAGTILEFLPRIFPYMPEKCLRIGGRKVGDGYSASVNISMNNLVFSIAGAWGDYLQTLVEVGGDYFESGETRPEGAPDSTDPRAAHRVSFRECTFLGNKNIVNRGPEAENVVDVIQTGVKLNNTFNIDFYDCCFAHLGVQAEIYGNQISFFSCRMGGDATLPLLSESGYNIKYQAWIRGGQSIAFYGSTIEAGGILVKNDGGQVSFYDSYFELAMDSGFYLNGGFSRFENCFISRMFARIFEGGASSWNGCFIRMDLDRTDNTEENESISLEQKPFIQFISTEENAFEVPFFVFTNNKMIAATEHPETTGLAMVVTSAMGKQQLRFMYNSAWTDVPATISNYIHIDNEGGWYWPNYGVSSGVKVPAINITNKPANTLVPTTLLRVSGVTISSGNDPAATFTLLPNRYLIKSLTAFCPNGTAEVLEIKLYAQSGMTQYTLAVLANLTLESTSSQLEIPLTGIALTDILGDSTLYLSVTSEYGYTRTCSFLLEIVDLT